MLFLFSDSKNLMSERGIAKAIPRSKNPPRGEGENGVGDGRNFGFAVFGGNGGRPGRHGGGQGGGSTATDHPTLEGEWE